MLYDIIDLDYPMRINEVKFASVVQRLVCKFSKLEMRFRLPPLAPENRHHRKMVLFVYLTLLFRLHGKTSGQCPDEIDFTEVVMSG